jgi:hypothetical protein
MTADFHGSETERSGFIRGNPCESVAGFAS